MRLGITEFPDAEELAIRGHVNPTTDAVCGSRSTLVPVGVPLVADFAAWVLQAELASHLGDVLRDGECK